jgi:hypothetical protein
LNGRRPDSCQVYAWLLLVQYHEHIDLHGLVLLLPVSCIIYLCSHTRKSRDSRDSDWLRTGRQRGRSSSLGRVKDFLFFTSSPPILLPTQFLIKSILGALSPGLKRQGREADHSPPTNAEVKKT